MPRAAGRRAVLLSASLLASCAWASDRAADLADVFVLEASAGLGVAVDVKVTDLVHVGAGYAHARKAGLRGRQPVWMWDREVGLPASAVVWLGALRDGELWRLLDLHVDGAELWHGASSPWRLADIEVGLFAGVVGLRFGFSPGELVDLLAGLATFDPAGDDDGPPADDDGPTEPGLWLVGDLHDHCDPPDGGHAPVTPAETHALARANGLDFVGINPHLWLEGTPPGEREDLRELAAQVRALEAEGDPIVIPGLEVMLRGRRSGGHLGAQGHVLLLFRDLDEAFALDQPLPDERAWVEERLATVPPARRLWVPAHPWPHPKVKLPFFPDWAADWKQLDELPAGEVELAGRRYQRWATPRREREERDGGRVPWQLVRYRLDPEVREALPASPPIATTERGRDLGALLLTVAPPAMLEDEALLEFLHTEAALAVALAREDADAPVELELALDVGQNAWLWARVALDGELTLSWGASRPGVVPLHDVPVDGLETISGLLHLASLAVGRRGDELDIPHVFEHLERRMLAERRRLVPLAGSDNHRDLLFATVWTFARERSRGGVFDALRAGRVCVGGPETTSFRARTDQEPTWSAVGAALRADRWVELRWQGEAELFVDGRSLGDLRGGFRHEVEPGAFHIYRIVRGPSWSGFIHVNLPEERE